MNLLSWNRIVEDGSTAAMLVRIDTLAALAITYVPCGRLEAAAWIEERIKK